MLSYKWELSSSCWLLSSHHFPPVLYFFIFKKTNLLAFSVVLCSLPPPCACTYCFPAWNAISPVCFPSGPQARGQLLGNFTSGWRPSSYYGRSSFSPYHAIFNYLNVCLLDCDLLEDRVCVLYLHAQCLAQRKGSIDINGRNEDWDDPRGMRRKRKWSL